MSSYVYKKGIRYRFPQDKANEMLEKVDGDLDKLDLGSLNRDVFRFDYGLNWDTSETELYLDKIAQYRYDEICGDFTKSRLLTDKELGHHLSDFQSYDPDIKAEDLRAFELCYYNGVDCPSCYDLTDPEETDWIF